MKLSPWLKRASLTLALSVLTTLFGCASERAPINRVDPNALGKDFFVGDVTDPNDNPEFYWRNFVVDGSESQSLIGIGSWSGVDRIRWEITEKMLFARKAYSVAPGADDKGLPGQRPSGAVVAAYPILKHFDIQRSYNSSTGEELNVVEENSSDRPWNERKYFRVDWSINLVDTPLWYDMFVGNMFGQIGVTPLTYYVNDPGHPDAPHFDVTSGYFDITSKFFIKPDSMSFADGSSIPVCMLVGLFTGAAVNNCDPQEAVVRSSYLRVDKVDPDNDFEPFENTRAALEIIANPGGIGSSDSVGIVTAPRVQWDPQYGFTDAGMRRFMHLHNIWEKSHQTRGSCGSDSDCGGGGSLCTSSGTCTVPCTYVARSDANGNGTDDQCENSITGYAGSGGSQCSARNRCTIPYRDRTVKPILYWMNKETPLDLTDPVDASGNPVGIGPTEDLGKTWNQVLRHSVAKAREVECRRTMDGDRQTCNQRYFDAGTEMVSFGGWGLEKPKADIENVFEVCHNPVRSYDNRKCGEVGYSARVGDLRHNFLFYWPYSSRAPWGGIANWNADPLTGQILGASATTMGRSATFSAAFTRDAIMVANGELDVSEITNGTPAYRYQKQLREGRLPKTYTNEELDQIVASVNAANAAQQLQPIARNNFKESIPQYFKMLHASKPAGFGTSQELQFQALADKLRGSRFEAQVIDKNWLVDSLALTGTTENILELASPLRGLEPSRLKALESNILAGAERRGVCYFEPFIGTVGNGDVVGVARYFKEKHSNEILKQKYPAASDDELSRRRADAIYQDLWKEAYKGIQLHEIGHSLGMLHEFASSYDSTNYNPQYWQLRTRNGEAAGSCNGSPRSGNLLDPASDNCMGPRYLDPENLDELGQGEESRPGISYFGHTSTMEYQNERFFESAGLGQFDLHTMNVLYGRVVQTFDADATDGMPLASQDTFAVRNWSQLTDYSLAQWATPLSGNQPMVQPMHYTEAARQMKLFDPSRCRPATAEEKAHAEWRVVHGLVCAPPPKDHATWEDFQDGGAVGNDFFAPKVRVRSDARTAASGVRWPYRWGVTNNAYLHTNPSDAGADVYEVTRATIEKFDYSYPFRYFRRSNRDWFYPFIPSRTISDFYERLRSYHWGIANNNAYFRSFGEADYQALASSDDWWRPYLVAERAMFDNIVRALLMPEIGGYGRPANPAAYGDLFIGQKKPVYLPGLEPDQGTFVIDAATGRYISPSYNDGPSGGGSWEYQNWINWVGFSIEKSEAGRALTDGRPVFLTNSDENYLDGRGLNVSFRTDMPEAVDRLIGGLLASDWETIAPFVQASLEERYPAVQMTDLHGTAPTRPSGALLLYPNVGYQQQISTLIWAHLLSRLDTDLTLANKMRIWVDGYLGEFNIPPQQQIRFTNPESGLTYVGRRYGPDEIDGKVVDKGVASRMLARANLILTQTFEVEKDSQGNPVLDAFGQPTLKLGPGGEPILVENSLIADYRLYVGLLDASVQISNLVGFGPFNF